MEYEIETKRTLIFTDDIEFKTFTDILKAALHENLKNLQLFKRDIKQILDDING